MTSSDNTRINHKYTKRAQKRQSKSVRLSIEQHRYWIALPLLHSPLLEPSRATIFPCPSFYWTGWWSTPNREWTFKLDRCSCWNGEKKRIPLNGTRRGEHGNYIKGNKSSGSLLPWWCAAVMWPPATFRKIQDSNRNLFPCPNSRTGVVAGNIWVSRKLYTDGESIGDAFKCGQF